VRGNGNWRLGGYKILIFKIENGFWFGLLVLAVRKLIFEYPFWWDNNCNHEEVTVLFLVGKMATEH
jgi:hypothetical protein